jgi:hypothetical protein
MTRWIQRITGASPAVWRRTLSGPPRPNPVLAALAVNQKPIPGPASEDAFYFIYMQWAVYFVFERRLDCFEHL